MESLTLSRCVDPEQWLKFVSLSPQGSRYATPIVIEALGCKADFWFLSRNGYPVAGVAVITENAAGVGLPLHSYYVGIMFHPEAWNCKANRRTENCLIFTEALMDELSQHYDYLELCLHTSIQDIRGIDWFNYHTPELGRAVISPCYTAQAQLQPQSQIRDEARGSRRREEKYACSREHLYFSLDGSVQELVNLYHESFKRQSIDVSEITLEVTRNFAEVVLKEQLGIVAVTRDQQGVAQTAGLMFFDYNGLVHLPVVGTSDTRYGGTMLYFGMMDYAAEQGYKVMDFNGANSPKRGYFKHSIGAKAQLYFYVVWEKPNESA